MATAVAFARPVSPVRAHPAVVRIVVPEPGGATLGSGALVAVNQTHGLVVTNWHVIRDSRGRVDVLFPDGFRSRATVLRADRDWDLAALVIWRPPVAPIPLAQRVPQRGEPLSIAGYGRGSYRLATGRCLRYWSPGGHLPNEVIELSAGARNGDSGGPILNQQGELAGVLFGASWGKTMGSHCMRVRQFLTPVTGDIYGASGIDPATVARQSANTGHAPQVSLPPAPPVVASVPTAQRRPEPESRLAAPPATGGAALDAGGWTASRDRPAAPATAANTPASAADAAGAPQASPASPTDGTDQTETFLAIVGLAALLVGGLRALTR
ncbi:MAG: trypsin-like peptidase domain-containing protein [Pirellulales bacterium]|nr:trypsin-like peptidase domain-containing protein [Pirellulales bacterium]